MFDHYYDTPLIPNQRNGAPVIYGESTSLDRQYSGIGSGFGTDIPTGQNVICGKLELFESRSASFQMFGNFYLTAETTTTPATKKALSTDALPRSTTTIVADAPAVHGIDAGKRVADRTAGQYAEAAVADVAAHQGGAGGGVTASDRLAGRV